MTLCSLRHAAQDGPRVFLLQNPSRVQHGSAYRSTDIATTQRQHIPYDAPGWFLLHVFSRWTLKTRPERKGGSQVGDKRMRIAMLLYSHARWKRCRCVMCHHTKGLAYAARRFRHSMPKAFTRRARFGNGHSPGRGYGTEQERHRAHERGGV
jgi:hypothetical protein